MAETHGIILATFLLVIKNLKGGLITCPRKP